MTRLHEIIAALKGIKSRAYAEVSELFTKAQKPDVYAGHTKSYSPRAEDGERFADERKAVELIAREVLGRVASVNGRLFDAQAQLDYANCGAKADLVLDCQVLHNVPVTYLLFLEKQVSDLRDFVAKMPVLDGAKSWAYDPATGLHRTEPVESLRRERRKRALVLYPATDKHPAQTQLVEEDETVGAWATTFVSGALPAPRKDLLLSRLDGLTVAVKAARARANASEAPPVAVGDAFFAYLLAP